jgi:hypothetical protein
MDSATKIERRMKLGGGRAYRSRLESPAPPDVAGNRHPAPHRERLRYHVSGIASVLPALPKTSGQASLGKRSGIGTASHGEATAASSPAGGGGNANAPFLPEAES